MYKLEQLDEYLSEIIGERFLSNMNAIHKEYQCNKNLISKEFHSILHNMFLECIRLQENSQKGKAAILNICYLYTSCLIGKVELQINIYDKNFYLDREEVVGIWCPSFIYTYYYEDIEYIQKLAKQNVIGFGYKDIQRIKQRLVLDYHMVTLKLLENLTKTILQDDAFHKVSKEKEFIFSFGGYMDQPIPLMKWEESSEE